MRIYYDHQAFNIQRRGGISRYILEIASRIDREPNCTAEIFALAHVNLSLAKNSGVRYVGWQTNERLVPASARARMNRQLAGISVKRFRPDIVHETYYSEHGADLGPAKMVVTVHDMIHEKFLKLRGDSASTIAAKRASVLRADHVICVSHNTKSDLLDLIPVSEDKVSVVHLGTSFEGTSHAADESKAVTGRPYLLYVGDRSDYKNFLGLLTAYASSSLLIDHFDLLCFGSHPFSLSETFAISESGLPRNRVRHEAGDDSALERAYRGAAVFVYPSLYEGFGLPPLEAMACDCPVVCLGVGSIPEVVGDSAMICIDESPEALQFALETLCFDEALKSEYVIRGRQRSKMFTWQQCALDTLAVYERTLGESRRTQ